MPLADNLNSWFDCDAGDVPAPRRRPQQDAGSTAPPPVQNLPSATFAQIAWEVPQRGRFALRGWQPTEASASLPWILATSAAPQVWPDAQNALRRRPWRAAVDNGSLGLLPPGATAESAAQEIVSQQVADVIRRPSWRPAVEPPAQVIQPPGVVTWATLTWFAGSDGERMRTPPRFVASAIQAASPIWSTGTGQPITPDLWGPQNVPYGFVRPAARFRATEQAALPPLLGVTDIPVSLIGWRDDSSPARWRRSPFHAQEIAALPPLPWTELPRYYAALLVPQADLVRSRNGRPQHGHDEGAVLWQEWYDADVALGHLAWDAMQPYPRLPRRKAWTDAGAWPVLDATALAGLSWLPGEDGSRRRAPAAFRSFDAILHLAEVEIALPSTIAVAGPYYVCAAQMWQPGAIDGMILTAD
jgi:hypothetical protein